MTTQIKKILLVFFKIILALIVLFSGFIALRYSNIPDENDLALTPLAVDNATNRGAGFITNATGQEWTIVVSARNADSNEMVFTQIQLTSEPLQAVQYALAEGEEAIAGQLTTFIVKAKKKTREDASQSVSLSSTLQ